MWKAGSFIIFVAIFGVIGYDMYLHGSLERSNTGKVLKDTGALKYVRLVWEETKVASDKSAKWAHVNVPVYFNHTCVWLKPYLTLGYELGLIAYNSGSRVAYDISLWVAEKTPVVEAWIVETTPVVKDAFNNMMASAKSTAIVIKDQVQSYTQSAVVYAKEKIFVGSISPENLHRYTMEALNTTQVYAKSTFHWVYEKFQTLSRVQQ